LFVIPTIYSVLVRRVRIIHEEEPDTVAVPSGAGASMGPHQRRED
jgi:hypothetical protein